MSHTYPSLYRGAFFPETVPHTDRRKEKFAQVRGIRKDPQHRPRLCVRQSLGFLFIYSFMSHKVTAPTQKGIKATTEAINTILEGSAQLQICLNLFSAAAADNLVTIDQKTFLEAADLMKALNRLMHNEKARLDHMASNLHVECTTRRTINRLHRKASTNNIAN